MSLSNIEFVDEINLDIYLNHVKWIKTNQNQLIRTYRENQTQKLAIGVRESKALLNPTLESCASNVRIKFHTM